jgi:CDP-diacylglycerol--serine O-phosphatidyltransferase
MIIGGMLCDTLDGRVARKTGQSSKFGSELDSLADTVTFGLAPAMMMVVLTRREIAEWGAAPLGFSRFGEVALLIGFIYVCCTALRLARFNVETSISEAHHQGFRGLPSPGAAAAVVSTIFLHEYLEWVKGLSFLADILVVALPLLTLALAWLMVSRVPFLHAASAFFRRRPFWHMAPILVAFGLIILYTELMFFIGAWAFVLSGLVKLLTGKRLPEVDESTETAATSPGDTTDHETEQSESVNPQAQYPKRQINE